MYLASIQSAEQELSDVIAGLHFNEKAREVVASGETGLADLKGLAPKLNSWRAFEYSGAMSRMYSVFEWFVHEVVAEWLQLLAKHRPFAGLDERVRNTYLSGVGQILGNLEGRRFKDYTASTLVASLSGAVLRNTAEADTETQYELVPDAFLLHDRNLRLAELTALFAGCGLQRESGLASWLEKHASMKSFFRNTSLNSTTAGKVLADLIDHRNEAAHGGRIETFLGRGTLSEYCQFLIVLCHVLVEYCLDCSIEFLLAHGNWNDVGQFTETFTTPEVGVAIVQAAKLRQGQVVYLRQGMGCVQARIVEMRVKDEAKFEVVALHPMEVGLKVSTTVRKKMRIILPPTAQAEVDESIVAE